MESMRNPDKYGSLIYYANKGNRWGSLARLVESKYGKIIDAPKILRN